MIQQPTLHIQWYLHISCSYILGVSFMGISLALFKHRHMSISITWQKGKHFFSLLGYSESYWFSILTQLLIRIFKEKVWNFEWSMEQVHKWCIPLCASLETYKDFQIAQFWWSRGCFFYAEYPKQRFLVYMLLDIYWCK